MMMWWKCWWMTGGEMGVGWMDDKWRDGRLWRDRLPTKGANVGKYWDEITPTKGFIRTVSRECGKRCWRRLIGRWGGITPAWQKITKIAENVSGSCRRGSKIRSTIADNCRILRAIKPRPAYWFATCARLNSANECSITAHLASTVNIAKWA